MNRTDERETKTRPPRDNLVRALDSRHYILRQDDEEAGSTLTGHFAKFNEWTEIDSVFEGRFMERIAPGAFKKTFRENRDTIRPLFQHGRDPNIGDKVLGPIEELREDDEGAYYEVSLLDTSYNRDLIPGLEAGLYGASFRFRVVREEFDADPGKSDHNPEGIPERTLKEIQVFEFGPVTFPAYDGATAGIRSLTDEFIITKFTSGPGLEKLAQVAREREPEASTPASEPAPATPPPSEREEKAMKVDIDQYRTEDELAARMTDIRSQLEELHKEWHPREFDEGTQAEWDRLNAEHDAIKARLEHIGARNERLKAFGTQPERGLVPPTRGPQVIVDRGVEDIYNLAAYRNAARTPEDEARLIQDGAKRAIEGATFPHEEAEREKVQAHLERLFTKVRGSDGEEGSGAAALARHILLTGSPTYKRAFGKQVAGQPLTNEEARALSLTGSAGGFAVPFQLDPTIIPTSNGVVNPMREISRVESITVDEWRGVSSAGITAAYEAEATEVGDDSPTLVQPTVSTEKAQAFIPFSIEVGMDWNSLQADMARLLQDAKDELEAEKFVTGTGTNEPFGVLTGTTNTVNASAGADSFTLADLYALFGALPPRYRPRARWMADGAILARIRQFETSGGSNAGLWQDGLQAQNPDRLLGKPVHEASAMPDDATTGNKFLLFGDFSRFVIVDRVGLTVETVPHLVGTNHRPTGQRGLYAYWRNGSKVVDANAFRALLGTA